MFPIVSVIIVDYGKHLLQDCLKSLKAQTFEDFEIIVIDNNVQNRGFSAGCNEGIHQAKGEFIVLLNNDARANRNWLKELVRAADENPAAGMFASKVLKPNGKLESYGCYIHPDGNGMCRRNDRNVVDFPSGCAAMYRRSMLNKIGLFDERFFMYNEDTDLGLRAQKAGYKCVYVPMAMVTHLYSQSSSAYSLKKLFYVERNRIRIMWKHFTFRQIVASVPWTFHRYFNLVRGHA